MAKPVRVKVVAVHFLARCKPCQITVSVLLRPDRGRFDSVKTPTCGRCGEPMEEIEGTTHAEIHTEGDR